MKSNQRVTCSRPPRGPPTASGLQAAPVDSAESCSPDRLEALLDPTDGPHLFWCTCTAQPWILLEAQLMSVSNSKCDQTVDLYACPLLGFSGNQWPLNFSIKATPSLSKNRSVFWGSSLAWGARRVFKQPIAAAISLFMFVLS